MNVESVNAAFPRYPMTVEDKGWVYGVWYCGTAWDRVRLHGQYPPTFLKRAIALFPDAEDILHCPSGTVEGPGVTVDLMRDAVRQPQIQACATNLPFDDGSFDLYLSDPPYTPADSEKYGCKPYPLARAMKEAHRVLRVGGHFGILHTYYPSYRRKYWKLGGLIAVVTGFQRATRMFSIFERLPWSSASASVAARRARKEFMPRAAKRDALATQIRCFLDPRSFMSRDGREFLAGEDMSVRRHEVFERSGGFCEEPGCNRPISEELPSEHPNALHVHHIKHRSKGGAENMNNLQAACTRCHKKHHADRNPMWGNP